MYHLFLDDERNPSSVTWVRLPYVQWEVVRSHKEFTEFVNDFGLPEFVTFDHDLADEHYKVMQKEVEHDQKFTTRLFTDE